MSRRIKHRSARLSISPLSTSPLSTNPWTDEAIRWLRDRRRAGVPYFTIAQQLGMPLRAVQDRARALRLPPPRKAARSSPPRTRPWSDEESDTLRSLWGRESVEVLAVRFDRSPGSVQWMAHKLRLAAFKIDGCVDCTTSAKDQDARFCAAMKAAIKAGRERVPMVGIDTRPCTQNPILILIHNGAMPASASSLADCEIS
jgi:hypothetical protein